jgi:hypothetical protein
VIFSCSTFLLWGLTGAFVGLGFVALIDLVAFAVIGIFGFCEDNFGNKRLFRATTVSEVHVDAELAESRTESATACKEAMMM